MEMLTIHFRFAICPDAVWSEWTWEGDRAAAIEQVPSRFVKGADLFERIEEIGELANVKSCHLAGPLRDVSVVTMELGQSQTFLWHKIFSSDADKMKTLTIRFPLYTSRNSQWREWMVMMEAGADKPASNVDGDKLAERIRDIVKFSDPQLVLVESYRIVLALYKPRERYGDNTVDPYQIWYWQRIR